MSSDNKQDDIQADMKKAIQDVADINQKVKLVAINNILGQLKDLEDKQESELYEIKQKYEALIAPLIEQQQQIITGGRAVTDEEIKDATQFGINDAQLEANKNDSSGISQYWLKAFKNCYILQTEIKEHDIEILKHLQKVKIDKSRDDKQDKWTFEFVFSENEFFEETVLTKSIWIDNDDEKATRTEGTEITWKEDKNVTKKSVKKQQKNKKSGEKRTVVKQVDQESFFNFFESIDASESKLDELEDEDAEDLMKKIDDQHNIAEILEAELIPYSLEYYLGVAQNEEADLDDYMKDDDSDDSKDDYVQKPSKKKNK